LLELQQDLLPPLEHFSVECTHQCIWLKTLRIANGNSVQLTYECVHILWALRDVKQFSCSQRIRHWFWKLLEMKKHLYCQHCLRAMLYLWGYQSSQFSGSESLILVEFLTKKLVGLEYFAIITFWQ
jgi:hypothetical protein